MMGLLLYFSHPPVYVQRLTSSFPPPPLRLVVVHVAVMVLLLFTTERLMLIFALPWLSVLLVVVHIISCSPSPPCPLHCLCLTCNKWFHASFFFKYSFWTLSHLPPFPLFSFSPSFLMLVMSALACFGVTNHPLQNLRAKSKRPPTQKPCITIGCFLLATTYLALCLLLCVRPLACPALPWLAAASSCPLCDWLCWWRTCSSPKYGLLADRYHFCEKCFNEIQGENVSLGDDPSQPQT